MTKLQCWRELEETLEAYHNKSDFANHTPNKDKNAESLNCDVCGKDFLSETSLKTHAASECSS